MITDPDTLEMVGRLLIQTARNQRLGRAWFGWLAGSGSAPPDVARTLQQVARLPSPPTSDDLSAWRDTLSTAFRDWLALFEMVPAAEHRRLEDRCRVLEAECREKDAVIGRLNTMLDAGGRQQQAFATDMQKILFDQGRLMQNALHLFWQTGGDGTEPEKPPQGETPPAA